MYGRVITKNIGPGASDLDNFDELDTRSLQNVFTGSSVCELTDQLGTPYGVYRDLESNGELSREGNITCRTTGSFIGPLNVQFLVSEYGLSKTETSIVSVNSKDQAFTYHTLPEISSVSPKIGGENGGTYINIEGYGFDGYKDNTQVFVNNAKCDIVDIESSKLTCRSQKASDV